MRKLHVITKHKAHNSHLAAPPSLFALRVRKYCQIWRILRQNCSDDSTEVTEGVTSTPEIFVNKHSFVLTFFATSTIYVNCKMCKIKELLYCTTKQEGGKLRSKFTRWLPSWIWAFHVYIIVYTCQDHVLEGLKMAFFVVILDSKYSKMTPKFVKQKSQWLHSSIKFAKPGSSHYL